VACCKISPSSMAKFPHVQVIDLIMLGACDCICIHGATAVTVVLQWMRRGGGSVDILAQTMGVGARWGLGS